MKKKTSIREGIRHRLIKAMGGYTEQFTPIEMPPKINVQTGNIRKIVCGTTIQFREIEVYGNDKAVEIAKRRILQEIVKALDRDKFVHITEEELYGGQKILRGELDIVDKPREQL